VEDEKTHLKHDGIKIVTEGGFMGKINSTIFFTAYVALT